MRGGGKPGSPPEAEHRSWAVLLAAFALLIQLMIPSAVMAAQMAASGEVVCTGAGLETVRTPEGGPAQKGFAGLPCPACLGPVAAALPAPPPTVLPVTYAVARVVHAEAVRPWAAPARAPPRPPGQAPPHANA